MVRMTGRCLDDYGIYHSVSSNMASWEIPELNGGVDGRIMDSSWIYLVYDLFSKFEGEAPIN